MKPGGGGLQGKHRERHRGLRAGVQTEGSLLGILHVGLPGHRALPARDPDPDQPQPGPRGRHLGDDQEQEQHFPAAARQQPPAERVR